MGYIGSGVQRFNTADGLTVTGSAEINSLTYPTADGSNGQVLKTNGSGTLSFGTVSTDLVNDTSPQLGGDLQSNGNDIVIADTDNIYVGTSNDGLKIHHSNNNSFIEDVGTGNFLITTNGNNIQLMKNQAEQMLVAKTDGSVELYYDNAKKFETTSSGVDVTGGLNTTGNVGIGTDAPAHNVEIVATAAGSVNDSLQIRNNATSSGTGSRIRFINSTDNTSDTNGASISSVRNGDDNDLVFETENATRMTIDHAGKVGIGTSAPSEPLHISSTSGAAAVFERTDSASVGIRLLGNGMSASTAPKISSESGPAMAFTVNNGERVRIDSSGNLLVGGTEINPQNQSSGSGSVLRADGRGFFRATSATVLGANLIGNDGEVIRISKDGSTVGSISAGNGDLRIGTGNVFLRFFDATPAVIPRTASDGTSSAVVDLGNVSNSFKDLYSQRCKGAAGHTGEVHFTGSHDIRFVTNGNERVRIDSGSRMMVGQSSAAGIGTATDANSLELGPGYIVVNRDDTATATQLAFGKNGSVVGSVSTTGSGTTYNTTSDIRLKQDIEPLEATDKLMAMNPVSYNWKADPDGPRSMGFIAQEMEEVMPEAVSTGDDEDAMMSMDYGRITPILVSALQDAHKKIEELENRIAAMESK